MKTQMKRYRRSVARSGASAFRHWRVVVQENACCSSEELPALLLSVARNFRKR
ncbi:hypothetical protein QA641_12615 [Bradyrhizobium sp. CB1650]|uniref:hypothetical protein n=1 Tax=Bradyrhizobium sp. CB1650 TaxID=3039153 RepID=UPI0024357E6C|nr:hypothetical protein [Bradyrhizobium sp. CB1650]WGD54670.1 hypothetical protein QA641_12615 [Bradyrhizobium sp. CB1650]